MKLHDLNTIIFNENLTEDLLAICNHFVLGTLFIKLNFVWSVALQVLNTLADTNFSVFWKIYQNQLTQLPSLLRTQQTHQEEKEKSDPDSVSLIIQIQQQYNDLSHSTQILTYDQELWKILYQISSILSKETQFVVSAFGSFLKRGFRKYYSFSPDMTPCSVEILNGNKKMIQEKLQTFLILFSKYPLSDLKQWKDDLQTSFLL